MNGVKKGRCFPKEELLVTQVQQTSVTKQAILFLRRLTDTLSTGLFSSLEEIKMSHNI